VGGYCMSVDIPAWVYDFRHIIEIRQSQGYSFYVSGKLNTDAKEIAEAIYLRRQVHSVGQNIQIG